MVPQDPCTPQVTFFDGTRCNNEPSRPNTWKALPLAIDLIGVLQSERAVDYWPHLPLKHEPSLEQSYQAVNGTRIIQGWFP